MPHCVRNRNVLHPVLVPHALVLHLVNDAQRVAAVAANRLEQAHRILNRLQRQHDVHAVDVHVGGNFLDGWLAGKLCLQAVARTKGFVRRVAHGAADADGVVVAQIAADFADDHRHGVGREADVLRHVEVVQRLHQPDAPDLKEVIDVFAAPGKALDDGQYQPQVPLYELVARRLVAAMYQRVELLHPLRRENGQLAGVQPA